MTMKELLRYELEASREYFERSTRALKEEHSGYAPTPDQFTVASQVAHAAITIDWFLAGAFGQGFDMNFEEHDAMARGVSSLTVARNMLASAYAKAIAATVQRSDEEWNEMFPEGSLLSGPKVGIIYGIVEHSAHHRGALSVYARLLGLKPLMPYMELPE